jgi:hypothetical protein
MTSSGTSPAPSEGSGGTGGTGGPDPTLDQKEPRRKQNFGLDTRRLLIMRLITFGILAIPLLFLAALAIKFVSMPITQAFHDQSYDRSDYVEASERLWPVWKVNEFEPYLPYLTEGTDLLQQGKNAEAEEQLRESLTVFEESKDLDQPMHAWCKIRNNLAISIERQADEISDPQEQADRYFEAELIIWPCQSGGGGGDDQSDGGGGEGQGGGGSGEGEDEGEGGSGGSEGEEQSEGGKRIEEKRRGADEEAGNDPDEREKPDKEGNPANQGGEDPGDGGPMDPGTPKKEDPEGSESPEEATTEGEGTGDPKDDELKDKNNKSNGGEGETPSEGETGDPEKPW